METKTALLAGSLSLVSFLAGKAVANNTLVFDSMNFSIESLEAEADEAPYQALSMFLPPSEGFAPNVNVLSQPFTGSMDEYIEISKKEFEELGLEVLKLEREDKDTVVMMYAGVMGGLDLHCYVKGIATGDEVLLATGCSLDDQWSDVSDDLEACVDSFKLAK